MKWHKNIRTIRAISIIVSIKCGERKTGESNLCRKETIRLYKDHNGQMEWNQMRGERQSHQKPIKTDHDKTAQTTGIYIVCAHKEWIDKRKQLKYQDWKYRNTHRTLNCNYLSDKSSIDWRVVMTFECDVSSSEAISFVRRKQIPMALTEMGDWYNGKHILWFNLTRDENLPKLTKKKSWNERKVCVFVWLRAVMRVQYKRVHQ